MSMTHVPRLEELDVDGAIQEAASKMDASSRASFLRKAGVGAGAVALSGTLLGSLAGNAEGAVPKSDVAILNFALTLEYLEAAFYTEAVAKGRFGGELGSFARIVKAHEIAHVKFLESALGSAAVKKPTFDFKGTTTSKAPRDDPADRENHAGRAMPAASVHHSTPARRPRLFGARAGVGIQQVFGRGPSRQAHIPCVAGLKWADTVPSARAAGYKRVREGRQARVRVSAHATTESAAFQELHDLSWPLVDGRSSLVVVS